MAWSEYGISGPKEQKAGLLAQVAGGVAGLSNHRGSGWQPYRPIHRFPFSEELANKILLTSHLLRRRCRQAIPLARSSRVCLAPMRNPNQIPVALHSLCTVALERCVQGSTEPNCRSKASRGGASWLPACPGSEVASTTNWRRTCALAHGSTPAPPRGEDHGTVPTRVG